MKNQSQHLAVLLIKTDGEHTNQVKRSKNKRTEKSNTGETNLRRKTNIACKYLQGNNVNEGRKLYQLSEENTKRSNGHKQRKEKFRPNMSKNLGVIRVLKKSKVVEMQLMYIFKNTGSRIK